jgi:hypothetical protein
MQTLLGKFVTLTIGDKKCIVEGNEIKGLKSLYVRPQKNWPYAGTTYPVVPADIEIIVRNKVGATIVEDTLALPSVGMAVELQGDGLEVFAYYSPKQGLAVPYPVYNIEAGVSLGPVANTPSRNFFFTQDDYAFNILYPTTGYYEIPSYSREFRINSTSLGTAYLYGLNPTHTIETVDFQLAAEWVIFSPEKHKYTLSLEAPGGYNYIATSIEFR